jgi:endonuclease VIII
MPEGDTIHRAAATLQRALQGRVVTGFETGYAQLARFDDDVPLRGRTVEWVRAAGKQLLMRFSSHPRGGGALTLRTHMRMSGSWHIYRPGERWQRPRRDMRIVVATEAYVAVAFSVPEAEFLDDRALHAAPAAREATAGTEEAPLRSRYRAPALRRLGPDLLGETFDIDEAVRRARAGHSRPVSELLLDQTVAAGAGNIFRSESLFLAGLDPSRPIADLPDEKLRHLFAVAARIMRANVATGARGSGIVTASTLRRSTGRSDAGARLWVYGRRGKPCRRCGTPIAYEKTGPHARGLYYCRTCQR